MLIDQTWKNEFINNLLHNKLKRKKKRVPPAIPRNLGIRRYRGTCPPSNPFRTPGPDRDFWPLMPKPQLFPCPAEIPLPFLSRPRLLAQIVQPEPHSWRCSNHRSCCCCLADDHQWSFLLRMEFKTSEVACLGLQSCQVSLSSKKKN